MGNIRNPGRKSTMKKKTQEIFKKYIENNRLDMMNWRHSMDTHLIPIIDDVMVLPTNPR